MPNEHAPIYDDKAKVRDTLDLSKALWRRPNQGAETDPGEGQVEIAFVDGYIAMRNSAEPDGTVLVFTPAEWDAFVEGAKDGEFNVPE